ncbi:MAG: TonB-dependent receptor, partial [Bacteroidales bacterium]|nr:TonB-dependent receptor [Bacteroidales bacterium]
MDKQKRNTKTKQLVMNILLESSSALCHEDIAYRLAGKIDRVTIYRILQGFCDDGKVHKIPDGNGKTWYALCHSCSAGSHKDDHLHFRCITCDTITCMDEPVAKPNLPSGYQIADIACFISGYCPKCMQTLKLLCCLFLLSWLPLSVFSQHRITILDKETKQAIPSAGVYFPDLKTSAVTDTNGSFVVNYGNQSVLMQVSCVGYKTFLDRLVPQDNAIIYLNPSYFDLQEVVISGNSSKLQGENVSNVEKMSLVNNTETHGLSLAEKLSGIAGLGNFSTGSGIGKPVIRGLSGNRIAVFSQGVRIENQQWGDEHGLGLDENGYEQVEIIKGPASLLYGSDALGGVLYFMDERYAKENSIEALLSSEYHTNTNGWRNTGKFRLSKDRWHWNLFGGYTTHQDYKDGNSVFIPNTRFRTGDLKTSIGYTGNNFITSLKYGFLNEQYGLYEGEEDEDEDEDEESAGSKRKPMYPYQGLTTHLLSSENTFFLKNNSRLKLNVGYVFNNRKEYEEESETGEAVLNMNLSTLSYDVKWYSSKWQEKWMLIAGSQGMYQTNKNRGEEYLIPDALTFDMGLFVMSDYYYASNSYWQIGLRADGRHIKGEQHGSEEEEGYFPFFAETYPAFNFSTGIYQQFQKGLSLRVNISSGYRSPNMFELLSDGVHEGTNRYETGNADMKAENSYQADISFAYEGKYLELFINPYFSYIRKYIYLQPAGEEIDSMPAFYYTQTDAFLYGGEAGFHVHPLKWLHLEGSYS